MKTYSLVGYPLIIENKIENIFDFSFQDVVLTGFFPKGTLLRGFSLQKNHYFNNRTEIFKEYETWENSKGIGVAGNDIAYNGLFTLANKNFYSSVPVMVGDRVNGDSVMSAVCEFVNQGFWNCNVQLGDLPNPLELIENDNNFNNEIINTLDSIYNLIDKYYILQSDPSVESTIDAKPILRPQSLVDKQKIKDAIDNLKEVLL